MFSLPNTGEFWTRIPCDSMTRSWKWMGISVTSFLPLSVAVVAQRTLGMVTVEESRAPSCKWNIQVPPIEWLSLCLQLATVLGLLDFSGASGVAKVPLVSPHPLWKAFSLCRCLRYTIQLHIPPELVCTSLCMSMCMWPCHSFHQRQEPTWWNLDRSCQLSQ